MSLTFLIGLVTVHSCAVGSLLKETIEDLEWTAVGSNNSTVEVYMQRQPRRLVFTAQAAGSLQVCYECFAWHTMKAHIASPTPVLMHTY